MDVQRDAMKGADAAPAAGASDRGPRSRSCGDTVVESASPRPGASPAPERRTAGGLWDSLSAPLRAMLPRLAGGVLAAGVFDNLPVLVLVRDPHGRVVLFNRVWTEWTGFTADDTAGQDWFETFLPERERAAARSSFVSALCGGGNDGRVKSVFTRGGSERKIQWWDRPLLDAQGQVAGLVSVGIDLSTPSRSQSRLVEEERLAAISEMMNGLAHESRNALQRSQACLDVLGLKIRDRPDLSSLVERIQRAHDHLHHLYEEVRAYAAPLSLRPAPVDWREVVDESWERLKTRHPAVSERSRLVVAPGDDGGRPVFVNADRLALRQVLLNILENSVCASGESSIITIRWRDGSLDGQPAWVATIHDDGPGFSAEARARVFEPFFTTKTQGTGLGMATARRIMEAHGGAIAVGDGPPGAMLLLTLPRVRS